MHDARLGQGSERTPHRVPVGAEPRGELRLAGQLVTGRIEPRRKIRLQRIANAGPERGLIPCLIHVVKVSY